MGPNKFLFNAFIIDSLVFNINPDYVSKSQKLPLNVTLEMEAKKSDILLKLYQKISINNNASNAPFTLEIRGIGFFEFGENIENADIEELCHVNCAAIMFPFMREAVANIIGRSGLPPLFLPPVNFVNRYKEYKAHLRKAITAENKLTEVCLVEDKPKKVRARRVQKKQ